MAGRDKVIESLRAEEVAAHYDIRGPWRGRWMRSKRCPKTDHSTDAMGLARDGHWHCHACDIGGDLLNLIAFAENLDVRHDFPAVLEVAAEIAGVVDADDFGGGAPAKPTRPPPPPIPPLAQRLELAKRRAEWAWNRLGAPRDGRIVPAYLAGRGLDADAVLAREEVRSTPLRVTREQWSKSEDLERMAKMFQHAGIVVPVRACSDGQMVDIRVRRCDPRPDQPKIVGMLGGIVRAESELIGCYGRPHAMDSDLAIVVEGLADYLTALQLWPTASVLGAVDAGSFPLVAAHAAQEIAAGGDGGRILIVEQHDGEGGAAELAVNNAAKRALAILGPRRVGWLFCSPHKDLNDLLRAVGPQGVDHEIRFPYDEVA